MLQVTALNAIYGVEAWNFGSRTLKGRTGNKGKALNKTQSQIKAEPATTAAGAADAEAGAATAVDEYDPAVDLAEAVAPPVRRIPSKKGGGVRKSGAGSRAVGKKAGVVQICRDCGQVNGDFLVAMLQYC